MLLYSTTLLQQGYRSRGLASIPRQDLIRDADRSPLRPSLGLVGCSGPHSPRQMPAWKKFGSLLIIGDTQSS